MVTPMCSLQRMARGAAYGGIGKSFSGLGHEKYFLKKYVQVFLLRFELEVAWFVMEVLTYP